MSQNNSGNSKFKLEFTLKQHTPIIHFQTNQKGATLRATELKPKLDRFLIEKLDLVDDKKKPKKEYENWFIGKGKQHLALDYKIQIQEDTSDPKNIDNIYLKLYFAGREQKKEKEEITKKIFKFNNNDICVQIISFHIEMNRYIEQLFAPFIFQTNFGTRQSKGFGSFNVKDINPLLIPSKLYSFSATSKENAFKKIDYFYRMLRSGINELKKEKDALKTDKPKHTFYGKSLLWLYVKDDYTWDKKAIKNTFLSSHQKYLEQKKHYTDASDIFLKKGKNGERLVRDLLGLSSQEQWLAYDKMNLIKEDFYKDKEDNPIIKRFKSPIHFKPYQIAKNKWTVYFWALDIPSKYLQNSFNIKTDKTKTTLKLDIHNEFDIHHFLKFIFVFAKKGCLAHHIDSKFHVDPPNNFKKPDNYKASNYYRVLKEIFDSIKEVTHA
jgi:hypothetical protein